MRIAGILKAADFGVAGFSGFEFQDIELRDFEV